jgi:predicted RNA polymerase sigma factor
MGANNPRDGVLLTDTSNPSGSSGPSSGSQDSFTASGLVEHFFRREYGRLVAILTREVGVRHVDLVEDAVQTALMTALTSWVAKGVPEDPGAWFYRVAHNHLIGALRNNAGRLRILEAANELTVAADNPASPRFEDEVREASSSGDNMLRPRTSAARD